MKAYLMILLLGLLSATAPSPVIAAAIPLDVDIPTLSAGALSGHGQNLALRVDDTRTSPVIGKTLEGMDIVSGQDLDAGIDNSLSDVLRGNGFLPQMNDAGASVRVHVRLVSLHYSAESHYFLTTKAHLDCKIAVEVIRPDMGTSEHSYEAHGDYTSAWRPTSGRIAKQVNATLHDALQAMLEDRRLAAWLNSAPQ